MCLVLTRLHNQGDHIIEINRTFVGKTCGLLPVGVDSTVMTTEGFRWNLGTRTQSPFAELRLMPFQTTMNRRSKAWYQRQTLLLPTQILLEFPPLDRYGGA